LKVIQINPTNQSLYVDQYPDPVMEDHELLIQVEATALNRADLLQKAGLYPPPSGVSPIMGLEMAGTVVDWGSDVDGFAKGDRICGLLAGGGYAQKVVLAADLALRMPDELSFTDAAAIPEVFLTAFQALHWLANIQAGESVLIHAGASGVGTAAIQLAKLAGADRIYITASKGKHSFCQQLGAHVTIDYKAEDFAEVILADTQGKGVDIVIDFVGGPHFNPNLKALAMDGRMVMLAFLGGTKSKEQINLAPILRKRIKIMGSTLRARSLSYKTKLTADFRQRIWPYFAKGTLRPIVDTIYPWTEVNQAHQYMEENKNVGKIVLKIGSPNHQI
jgi:putative PIG3 family NAD(P)H quinone oxidoreductase